MTPLTKKQSRALWWFSILVIFLLAASYFLLPLGFPKPASPNCGPEQWRWLGERFSSKADVLDYLKRNEISLLAGTNTPRLGGYPPEWSVGRMDVTIDWVSIENSIQVKKHLGYTIYILTYNHPACYPGQLYTFKVTSYGFASLYGCCGI